jgi:hypothetical protein
MWWRKGEKLDTVCMPCTAIVKVQLEVVRLYSAHSNSQSQDGSLFDQINTSLPCMQIMV